MKLHILNDIYNNFITIHKQVISILLILILLILIFLLFYLNKLKNKEQLIQRGFQSLFDNMKEGFALHEIICDEKGNPFDYRFLDVNTAFEEMTGLHAESIINKTVREAVPCIEEDWIKRYGEVAATGTSMNFTNYSRALGKHLNVSVYRPAPGKFITIFTDITAQILAREELRKEKKLLETILEDTLSGYWDWDLKNDTEYYSPSFKKMFGYEDWEIKNIPGAWQKYIHKDDLMGVLEKFDQHFKSLGEIPFYNEIRYDHKDGSVVWVICSGRVVEWSDDSKPLRMVGCHIDITSLKKMEETLTYLSFYDQLTGVSNRSAFENALQKGDAQSNLPYTIVVVDVNGLKLTNDTFGHLVGDELLKYVAKILKRECNPSGMVARTGGDEFVLLLPNTNHQKVQELVKRIYKAISQEKLNNMVVSVSIGWQTKTSLTQTMAEIYKKAEEHMYRKKLTESQSMRNQTIQVIINTLNQKYPREKIHSDNVSKISRKVGEILQLDEETLKEIEFAGLLHDIGKIVINENILNKTGKLTEEEYVEIKRHTESSYHILKSVDAYTKLADYVLSHHERWDGKGYPRGLKAEEIPFISRIISVADAYEAMIADRPYRKGMDREDAYKEIQNCSGTQFDPKMVDAFIIAFEKNEV